MRRGWMLLGLLALLPACGRRVPPLPASARGDLRVQALPGAAGPVPAWAQVSEVQRAEARRWGVPVAFENSLGMRFVLLPAGCFTMGSPAHEPDRDATESAHRVTLTRPRYMQVTEVTNAQFRRFRPAHRSGSAEAGALDGEEQPVVSVAWDEAVAFTQWLSREQPGHAYRLPTEAEWEHACRAGTSTAYWWGDTFSPAHAHMAVWPARGVTAPVGTLPANPWGLHDMHGNASEWCADRYDDRDCPPGPATDPPGPRTGDSRVRRGGEYDGGLPHMARAAFRIGVGGGEARTYVGFRVAASLP